MPNLSIFPTESFDRAAQKWEDFLDVLTPVEYVEGTWFKREDAFAPLGYGRVNGAKLRQLIWLVSRHLSGAPDTRGILSGAVAGSPQHPMVAAVAKHYGLMATLFTGVKDVKGHRNLELAGMYGASLELSKVGYAKTLEAKVFEAAAASEYAQFYALETNITVTEKRAGRSAVAAFHVEAAKQVQNIPAHIRTLILPCGSAISATSVMAGLARYETRVQEIVLMGIGNVGSTDLSYLYERVETVEPESRDLFSKPNAPGGRIRVTHIDLNSAGFCRYEDLMPAARGHIVFHPRYEGKCITWLRKHAPEMLNKSTLFWVIGSEPGL